MYIMDGGLGAMVWALDQGTGFFICMVLHNCFWNLVSRCVPMVFSLDYSI
jgi:hypothetical protein